MPLPLASLVLSLARLYLIVGVAPALLFVLVGAGRIDPAVRGPSPVLRALLLPASLLLWPLLALRWIGVERTRRAARAS